MRVVNHDCPQCYDRRVDEHLPGCDRRHTRRQRCSTWEPPPAPADAPPVPDAATARTPWRRVILALALSPFIPLAIILALGGLAFTGGLVSDPHGFVSRFKPDPILPAWAYPEGDVIRDGGCGGNDPKRPPCQWIIVGTNAPIEGIRADLEAAFSERGWDISDIFLRAKSPKGDVCIAYSHRPWETSHRLFQQDDGQGYSTEISISVDNCAPYAG